MDRKESLHLCLSCGKPCYLEVVMDSGFVVNREFPRECSHCKELKTYLVTPISNYSVNITSLIKRVHLLEKRVKELENK